jgi:hypothetical protein
MGCWDEFAATYFSAGYGADPTDSFEELFLQALSNAPSLVQTALAAFRTTRNAPRLLNEAASAYGLLLKYSAYHLGNLRGQERTVDERPRTLSALAANPWFNRYFDRLSSTCNKLLANFGRWPDTGDFESIADLLEELMSNAGLQMQDGEGGGLRLYVNEQRPWTPSQARPRTAP